MSVAHSFKFKHIIKMKIPHDISIPKPPLSLHNSPLLSFCCDFTELFLFMNICISTLGKHVVVT